MPVAGFKSSKPGALSKFESFAQALSKLNGEASYSATKEDTEVRIKDLVRLSRASSVAVAGLPDAIRSLVLSSLENVAVVDVSSLNGREAAKAISSADVGITWAAAGLAKEGALVEVTWDDAAKLASSLPLIHLALLSERNLLTDLTEAMLEAGRIVKSSALPKPVVSFIAGPSKTGDIEGKLLHGVHGPHSVFAIVLGWA